MRYKGQLYFRQLVLSTYKEVMESLHGFHVGKITNRA